MKNILKVAGIAVGVLALNAVAEEAKDESLEVQEAEKIWSVGADIDYFSAYVWRNAVQNDRMVIQPCVWGDLTVWGPFSVGGFIWQNYDLTSRRRDVYRRSLAETDYNAHVGAQLWASEEEEHTIDFEFGHDWYTYQQVRHQVKEDYKNSSELYAKLTYANPFVDVYGQVSWMYKDFGSYQQGFHWELGFKKEVEVTDELTLGADWNVSFGDTHYLYFLYGGAASGEYDHSDDPAEPDIYDDYDSKKYGFGGTTIKVYASYALTDWMSLKGTLAYTGLLNGNLRDAVDAQGKDYDFYGDSYPRDLLWGGLSLNIEF